MLASSSFQAPQNTEQSQRLALLLHKMTKALSHMVPSSLMILLGLCHKVKSHYTMNDLAGYEFHLFSSFKKKSLGFRRVELHSLLLNEPACFGFPSFLSLFFMGV